MAGIQRGRGAFDNRRLAVIEIAVGGAHWRAVQCTRTLAMRSFNTFEASALMRC